MSYGLAKKLFDQIRPLGGKKDISLGEEKQKLKGEKEVEQTLNSQGRKRKSRKVLGMSHAGSQSFQGRGLPKSDKKKKSILRLRTGI